MQGKIKNFKQDSQNSKILAYLMTGASLTCLQASLMGFGMNLRSRVSDLKRAGYDVKSELIPINDSYIAEYKLTGMITIKFGRCEMKKIYNKIIKNQNLTEKEMDLVSSDSHKIAVYGFTHSIGHLTLFGKNEMVKQYKYEILQEMRENCGCIAEYSLEM